MATKKVRYIIFKLINSDNILIQMENTSFLKFFKDKMYKKYGLMKLTRFDDVNVISFFVNNQILVLRVPRCIKKEIIESVKELENISGREVKFESIVTKSSIKRVREFLKRHITRNMNKK